MPVLSSSSLSRDSSAEPQECEGGAPRHERKGETALNASLERYYAKKLGTVKPQAPSRRGSKSDFSSFTSDWINATKSQTEAPKAFPQTRNGEGDFAVSRDERRGRNRINSDVFHSPSGADDSALFEKKLPQALSQDERVGDGSTNGTEAPKKEAEEDMPSQEKTLESNFSKSLDGGKITRMKRAAVNELPRDVSREEILQFSVEPDDGATLRKEDTGTDFDLSSHLSSGAILRKEAPIRSLRKESEGLFNFSADVEAEEDRNRSAQSGSKIPLPNHKAREILAYALTADHGGGLQKEGTGADFTASAHVEDPAPLSNRASGRISSEGKLKIDSTLALNGEAEKERAQARLPELQQHPWELKVGGDPNCSEDANESAVHGKETSRASSPQEKTGAGFKSPIRSNYDGVHKLRRAFPTEAAGGDSDFSVDDEGAQSKQTTTNPLSRKVNRRKDFEPSLDGREEVVQQKKTSTAFLQNEEAGAGFSMSAHVNAPGTIERRAENNLYSEGKSEGDFDFLLDGEVEEGAQPKGSHTERPPPKSETEGDFPVYPKAGKKAKLKPAPPRARPRNTKAEGDLNFFFDDALGSAHATTDEGVSFPLGENTERPGKEPKAEENVNFSLNKDLGGTHQEAEGDPNFFLAGDLGRARKEAPSTVSPPTDRSESDFNFSFDLDSLKKPGKPAVKGGSKDDTDVYTLLDEEEEDEDEDSENTSKAGLVASSAKPKARFNLKAQAQRKQKTLPSSGKGPGRKQQDKQQEPLTRAASDMSDAWYTMNTTASSADVVKSLEAERTRQREARHALEEKLLNAPPLTNMYTRAVKTIPATHYLGVGYDAVKGNPLGDPTMMADPGLRSPIMAFTFEQSQYGVTNDLTTLQPLGAYTRPFAACRQSETVSELNTLDDYQKELSVDASMEGGDMLGLNRFSGSGGYQNFAKELSSKNTKSYLLRTYCIRYEAGLAQTPSFHWNYTLAFQDALSHLPTDFEGGSEDSPCNAAQWRQDSTVDACADTNIPTWMDFIQQFGTHYIVRLFAGGKMTYQVSMKSSDVRKLKTKGVDVKSELKLMIGGFGGAAAASTKSQKQSVSNVSSLDIEKETLVIGGKPPGNVSDPGAMAQWSESVEEMPMPVKAELKSLDELLPEENKSAFRKAAKYYGKAYGMSVQDLQALELAPKELPDILRGATQVAWAGSPPGYAKCPIDTVVLFGYAIKLNFNRGKRSDMTSYRLIACAAGREKCDGVGNVDDEDDDERIFVVCGKETLNALYQVVGESPHEGEPFAVATCPEEAVIILGFGLAISVDHEGAQHVEVESCRAGQTLCTKSLGKETHRSFVWIVCAEKNYPGIKHLHNVARIDSRGPASRRAKHSDGLVTISCPKEESVLLGFAMEAHTRMPQVRESFTTCDKGKSTCSLQGAGVDNAIFGVDHHSLFGWAVCSPNEKEVAHAVTENPQKGKKVETTGSQNNSLKRVEGRTG